MICSAIKSMQAIASEVKASESLINIKDHIAPIQEIFRLQGADELLEAEKRYLNKGSEQIAAVVLAASPSKELQGLTLDKPKVMLTIDGKPLLSHLIDKFKKVDISDITVVGGYKAETIDVPNIKLIQNWDYATTRNGSFPITNPRKFRYYDFNRFM